MPKKKDDVVLTIGIPVKQSERDSGFVDDIDAMKTDSGFHSRAPFIRKLILDALRIWKKRVKKEAVT